MSRNITFQSIPSSVDVKGLMLCQNFQHEHESGAEDCKDCLVYLLGYDQTVRDE